MAVLNRNDVIAGYTVQSLIKSNLYTETYRVLDSNSTPFFLKLFILGKIPSKLVNPITGKVKDLHPALRDILHLGLYQIYELDKIPDSAAVNESVEMAKKYCKKQRYAPGLINAVLRKAAQIEPSQPTAWQEKYSHPQALIDLLKSYVGEARLEKMLIANNAAPQTVVQVNTRKITGEELVKRLESEGVTAQPHGWMPDCLVLSNTGSLEKTGHDGVAQRNGNDKAHHSLHHIG